MLNARFYAIAICTGSFSGQISSQCDPEKAELAEQVRCRSWWSWMYLLAQCIYMYMWYWIYMCLIFNKYTWPWQQLQCETLHYFDLQLHWLQYCWDWDLHLNILTLKLPLSIMIHAGRQMWRTVTRAQGDGEGTLSRLSALLAILQLACPGSYVAIQICLDRSKFCFF